MCLMDSLPVEATTGNGFADRMMDILNHGALALMISVGHRTGLFDTLGALPPASSAEIAAACKLNERYVREWLGAMVTGRIVEYQPVDETYHLPGDRAELLTRAAAPNNMASVAQFIPLLGTVEDRIVECFSAGGGVPYAEFPGFHRVMAEESDQSVCSALLDAILPLAPGAIADLERGIDVLDVGCGSGRAMNLLAQRFPNSRFAGYDICPDAVANARAEAAERGVTNARFELRDAAMLDETERYDLITAFDAIHDQARPAAVLAGIARALRPEGIFLMQDIHGSSHVHKNLDHPLAPMMYTISCMHCMTVSLASDGDGLGAMWGKELALKMLADAGFCTITVQQLPHDILNIYYVARRAA